MRKNQVIVLLVLLACLVLVGLCSASLLEVDWKSLIVVRATEEPMDLRPVWDGYTAPSH